MRYPNRYDGRDEVKVAVLVDEMRAEADDQLFTSDVLWGLAALASACMLFLFLN